MTSSIAGALAGSHNIEQALFFYGTLRAAEVREAVLGYPVPKRQLQPARLSGYQVRRVAGAFYPMLIQAVADAVVDGVIMTVTRRQDLDRLDRFEGADYQRVQVPAMCANGPRLVQVYQPTPHLEAAEIWDFHRWYETDLDHFLTQDFDLDGVRRP